MRPDLLAAFQVVGIFTHTSWWTVLVSAAVAFTFMGILQIAAEIENPFGYDYNGKFNLHSEDGFRGAAGVLSDVLGPQTCLLTSIVRTSSSSCST